MTIGETLQVLIAIGLIIGLVVLLINFLWVDVFCRVPVTITNHGTGRITNLILAIRGDTKTIPE
jgi:hypothetical protein